MAFTTCTNDETIGPLVRGCRGDFDFTQKFESVVFSIVPAAVFLVSAAGRVLYLYRKPPIVQGQPFRLLKIITIAAYSSLQFSLLVIICKMNFVPVLAWNITGVGLAFVAGLMMMIVSSREHATSQRPSFLLNVYLLITLLFDIVQARTFWLMASTEHHVIFASIFTASVSLKLVILVLESHSKVKWGPFEDEKKHILEQSIGIYSLAVYYWLKQLLTRGYSTTLKPDDLYELDPMLSAEVTSAKLMAKLQFTSGGTHHHTLLKALLRAFAFKLLLPVIPNLALISFTYFQTLFLQALLNHLNDPEPLQQESHQYGLMVACPLIYAGMSVSTALESYFSARAASMVRACLCAAIYKKTTEANLNATDGLCLTLMSADVENVHYAVELVMLILGSSVQAAIGCWLLYQKIGLSFLSPIVLIFTCSALLFFVTRRANRYQTLWLEKTQKRIAHTANAIANMKIFKMLGFAEAVKHQIQNLRKEEMRAATKFRAILLGSVALGFSPNYLTPAITFAFTFKSLDVATLFVSLSYMSLLAFPLSNLFQSVPSCFAALASINRIEEFLMATPRQDYRERMWTQSVDGRHLDEEGTFQCQNDAIGLVSLQATTKEVSKVKEQQEVPAFVLSNGSFGWEKDKMVLKNVDAIFQSGQTTMIIGPIASGKTSLCHALLGEIPEVTGKVYYQGSDPVIGYCPQIPFLFDATIKENIVGHSPYDDKKYHAIINATMLDVDVKRLPQRHETKIGSNGILLSGGQKQRVSLARALYLEADIVILDDVLSGLDAYTESQVFSRVFGKKGLLGKRNSTVIFSTHTLRYLSSADHIIVLTGNGTIAEQGSFQSLQKSDRYISEQSLTQEKSSASQKNVEEIYPFRDNRVDIISPNLIEDVQARPLGDWAVYKHYIRSASKRYTSTLIPLSVLCAFSSNFSTIWMSYWSSDAFSQDRGFYVGIFGLLRALQLIALVASAGVVFFGMMVSSGQNLHLESINTVIKAPLKLFTATDSGVITNLFSQDMRLIDSELPMALLNTVFLVFEILGNGFVAAIPSPYLAISFPGLIGVLYGIQMFYLRTSRQLRLLDLEAKSPLYSHFLNTMAGLTTIRSFKWIGCEVDKNNRLVNTSQRPAYQLSMIQNWLKTILLFLVGAIATIITILAIRLKAGSGFTGASLVTLITLANTMSSLMKAYTSLETSLGAVSRLRQFGKRVRGEDAEDENLPMPVDWPAQGRIELRRVSASYDFDASSNESTTYRGRVNRVLQELSVEIEPGQKIAICGRTGSGKSSLLLLLLRLLEPIPCSSMILEVDGISLSRADRSMIRNQLITLPQDAVFLPGRNSIKANLDPVDIATNDQCLAALESVNLAGFVRDRGGLDGNMSVDNLSVGQQQLFSLARCVLRRRTRKALYGVDGGIFLVDELNSKMDKATDRVTQEIIRAEFAAYTIIMVAHRLDIVMDLCDRVLILDQGQIVEDGSPKELADNVASYFSKLWSI